MYFETLDSLNAELEKLSNGIAVVLAAEKGFDYTKLQPMIRDKPIPVVGAFFPGVIANNELHYTGFLLQHLESEFEFQVCDSKNAAQTFSNRKIKNGTGIILMDSFAEGNQAFLNSIFYELGSEFKFMGSGAGSLELVQKPCVFDKDGIYKDKAIVLLTPKKLAIGLKHGYDRIAGPIVATKTKNSQVSELNWENAFDCYAEVVNQDSLVPVTKGDFFSVSKGYPLGISRKGHEDIVRDPISVEEDGTLNCIDDVPENAAVYILKGEPSKLINAAVSSCQEAIENVDGDLYSCFLIDCVSRVLYLGDDFSKEIEAATVKINSYYPDVQVEGILSLGEISTFKDGRLELYNKTFLTTLLYD